MPNGVRGSELRQIQALYSVGTFAGLGDGSLLERFATLQGEVAELAFAALVARHGPMVWRVCRRVLRDEHDAQDAFQATWLVLARKAGSLRDPSSVGNWLFGVASRVALDARAASSRRQLHERRYAESQTDAAPAEVRDGHDLGAALHEELRRLPERYRTPIVLCYLEGLSHEETALRLGCPVGTVRSRLARGRDRLRARLARRGVVPSAGALTAALACDAGASLPPALVRSAIQGAARFAAARAATTGAVISAQAAILCQGVLHTMLWTQLKTAAAIILVAGTFLATGAGVAAVHARKGPSDDRPASEAGDQADRAQVVRSLSFDTYNLVPGETTVISVLPSITKVKKGQLVCELDAAGFKDQLVNQKITTKAAEAAYQNAKLTREVAEIAVIEYTEGIHKFDMETVMGELALAAADLTRAIDRVNWASRMRAKGYVSKQQTTAEDISLQKALFALQQVANKKSVLENYTKEKVVKELKSEVQKALSDELARKATWELETAKTEHLRRDIARCKINAPADGELILAPGVAQGAIVRERQLIFRVLTKIRVEPPR
ncbi:MAG TPA: sigma-70 family RNA polymerase sigma factor [Isosphaeraceae bacterium]|nr:sigma-70 family RNA polymerase sigma factor [Isosphaeraceae bacterium]